MTPKTMSTTFKSVSELLKATTGNKEKAKSFEELLNSSTIVRSLIRKRARAGMTQKEVASLMGVTQSAVSKIETSFDCDLTLGEIARFSHAVDSPMTLQIGPPISLVQSVKSHAFAMKADLEKLAALACENEEDSDFDKNIANFFGEAGFNLMAFLVDAFEKLPASVLKAKTSGLRVLEKEECEPSLAKRTARKAKESA